MLKRIIDAILNKKEAVTLGLDKAMVIFQEAKGKFDGSANKAVPFAIMATARALGAEVTLFEEGKQKAIELDARASRVSYAVSDANQERSGTIAKLEQKIAELEETIKSESIKGTRRIKELYEEKATVEEVIDFFTV